MPGKVRFYRGAAGTSLPEPSQATSGSIFIIERQGSHGLGDMYVDMDAGKRLHIVPDNSMTVYQNWMSGSVSEEGIVYVFVDDNAIAVGDGNAFVGDLPRFTVTYRDAIQNKVNAYLGTEYNELTSTQRDADNIQDTSGNANPSETLVLSRELWLWS